MMSPNGETLPTLATLPDELLLMIVKTVLITPECPFVTPAYVARKRRYQLVIPGTASHHTAILQCCKSLHKVAVELLYGQHVFDFRDWLDLVIPWFAQIGPTNLRFVRSIRCSLVLDWNPNSEHEHASQQLHSIFRSMLQDPETAHRLTLTLDLDASADANSDTLIDQIVTFKTIAAIECTSRVVIKQICASGIFIGYFNRVIGLAAPQHTTAIRAGPQSNFEHLLTDLVDQVHRLEKLVCNKQDEIVPKSIYADNQKTKLSRTKELRYDHDSILPLANATHTRCQTMLEAKCLALDAIEAYAKAQHIFQLQKNFPSGATMSQLDLYSRSLQIEREKLRFLGTFWKELKSMGLVETMR